MTHPEADELEQADDRIERGKGNMRKHILASTAMLPALFTVLNGIAGFGSIHFATKDALGQATSGNLYIAAWLIFAAMVCDMLDGRLARMTRKTSDFGAQLDSLCDVVSFGVAPAVLMLRTEITAIMQGQSWLPEVLVVERLVWSVAALYLACATLRLARFNVENTPDESSHMNFTGLPSPAAAALIAALVLLFLDVAGSDKGWRTAPWLLNVVSVVLPLMTLLTALLMVSRFRYPHVVNQYIRGRKPFGYLVKFIVVAIAALMALYVTAVVVTTVFVVSGPVQAIGRKLRHRNSLQPQ